MPQSILRIKRFLLWWLIETPKNIFVTLKRFIVLLNNDISFTLNIRLLFTPLFGDNTLIGHIIGFCVRVFQIISGGILMIMITFATLIIPALWWAIPFYGIIKSPIFTLVGFLGAYLIWYLTNTNHPEKKTYQIKEGDNKQAFRPDTYRFLKKIGRNWGSGIEELSRSKEIKELLLRAELTDNSFIEKLRGTTKVEENIIKNSAFKIALDNKSRYVENEHLFAAVIENIPNIDTLLATFNSEKGMIPEVAKWIVAYRENMAKRFIWQPDYELLYTGGIGKGMTGVITPHLDAISTDFTKMAQKGKYKNIVGHKEKVKDITSMLKGSKNNILIIGPAGCGKTSVVKGIANEIIEGTEHKSIQNKRIVSLELSGLISGTTSSGQIAQKINDVIWEVKRSKDIILFLDEIHTTVAGMQTDTAEASSIFSILEPIISDEVVQVIGATTIKNYRKFIEPNEAFSRLFHIVEIDQTTPEETLEILKENSDELERKYGIKITLPALKETIKLSDKLIQERVHPDKALDIVERAAINVEGPNKILDRQIIARELSEITHVPVENISEDDAKRLLDIERGMKETVIGQDHAVKMVSSALKRARVGIRDESRPIASFLFVGTTGVGKTQTAKALAKSYFGNEKSIIRIDMSEYQQIDSIDRLIGSPDGSIRGYLTDQVRQRPFGVVLLDEIEKAHPNILFLFLQVLDEGFVTDAQGTKINFSNTLIIATSNVGTRVIQDLFQKGSPYEEMKEKALLEVRNHYAPEFLNRFTSIIVYKPLDLESVRKIALMLLQDVKNIAKDKKIEISFSDILIDKIIKLGYNPEWGARPLKRVIEDSVESYIATKMLTKEIKEGDVIKLGLEVFEEI